MAAKAQTVREHKPGMTRKRPDRFIEPDQVPDRHPKGFPENGRLRCKVFNAEMPGEDIEGCINGVTFKLQHGQEVPLSPSQVHALQNMLIETFEHVETIPGAKFEEKPISIPRVHVQILGHMDVFKEKEEAPEDGPFPD